MSTTYPLAQAGALTLPSGMDTVHFHTFAMSTQHATRSVGGSSGGATDTHPVFVHGLPVDEFIGYGVVKVDGAATYGLGQNSTLDPSTSMDVQCQNWSVRRRWQLRSVTGSGGSGKCWGHSVPYTSLNAAGVAKTGYIADHANNSLAVSAVLSQVGTIGGTLKLDSKVDQVPLHPGGNSIVRFAGMFSGTPTFTSAGSSVFDWLLATSVTAPVSGSMTVDIGDSTNLTPSVLVYDVALTANADDGGPVGVVARMRKHTTA